MEKLLWLLGIQRKTWKPQCDMLKWLWVVHPAPCGVTNHFSCHFFTCARHKPVPRGQWCSSPHFYCLGVLELKVLWNLCRFLGGYVKSTKLFIVKPHQLFFLCYLIAHLQERLDDYIKQWNGLVKVFRNERREGLIQARSIGAQKAKLGQVGASSHTNLSFLFVCFTNLIFLFIIWMYLDVNKLN